MDSRALTIPNSTIIKRQMYDTYSLSATVYATKADVWIGHYDALPKVPQIHQINLNTLCLLYRNIRIVWAPGSYEYLSSEYELFMDSGWILKDSSGELVNIGDGQGYFVDVGNPSYQQWVANWYKGYLDTYGADGAYIDNCAPNKEITYGVSAYPINPRTGRSWTTEEFKQAIINLVNKIKDTLNPKLVVGNTIFSGTHFFRSDLHQTFVDFLQYSKIDGLLSEGWISTFASAEWYSEDKWRQGIDMAVWIDENFLSRGNKIFWTMSDNAGLVWPEGEVRLPSGATKEQYVTYCYASRLLAIKHDENWINFGTFTPENYPQSLFKGNIGNPSGTYYKNGNLYIRQFTDGMVVVNPTHISQQVTLNEAYENAVDGVAVSSSLTVLPHTGIILKRTQAPS